MKFNSDRGMNKSKKIGYYMKREFSLCICILKGYIEL